MRKPMITRTITTTVVNVLCMDVVTCEPFNETVKLPRTYKDEESILKVAKPIIEQTENHKAVHIVDSYIEETLYGLPEDEFIRVAKVLPPRGTKASDAENEATE